MDAFFAAIEQLEHPEWRGQPVIVGGVHSARGVVSTASYEARVFGVRSAMPVAEARRRCPQGIYVPGRHEVYGEYSRRLMDALDDFSPVVEQISVDEAFLDMTGTGGLFGSPREAARKLKQVVVDKLGLTVSVGVAPNKFIAKIASDFQKPDGLTLVEATNVVAFLDPLPVEKLLGVGPRTAPALHRLGLRSIGQVRGMGKAALVKTFGAEFGSQLEALSRGEDPREIESEWREKSVSHETTFEKDSGDADFLGAVLLDLCDRVARRARKHGFSGRTVSLVWRDPDFSRHSKSRTMHAIVQDSQVMFETALPLLREVLGSSLRSSRKIRLLGVRLSSFAEVEAQLSLFAEPKVKSALDKAADAVRDRFGEDAVRRARLVDAPEDSPRPPAAGS